MKMITRANAMPMSQQLNKYRSSKYTKGLKMIDQWEFAVINDRLWSCNNNVCSFSWSESRSYSLEKE